MQKVSWKKAVLVCALLAAMVAAVFGQTLRHGFLNFDDGPYIYENQHVQQGLTGPTVAWAFSTFHASNWHPLTWLSHAADCQMFGLNAGGHHAVNVLLHLAVAIALFLTLCRMTGDFWPSAFVAAVFAIHPLRVESVAWVAERKDLLCGLFFILTIAAYSRYASRPFSLGRYLLVTACFAMALLAKPMAVTLPFVLLLLDFWPLQRTVGPQAACGFASPTLHASLLHLILEKLPWLAMSAGSCIVTSLAQQKAMATLHAVPLATRAINAAIAYVDYIGQLFWPTGLAVLYPYADATSAWIKAAAAVVALLAVSIAAVLLRRRAPWIFVGWFWYLGMLVPVLGLVQVGFQAMADRYTYLPQIGLTLAIVWTVAAGVRGGWIHRWACGFVAAVALAALALAAWLQTSLWRNNETLWRHTLENTSQNLFAHNNLGMILAKQQRFDEAAAEYEAALAIRPDAKVFNNFGTLLASQNRMDEAAAQFRKALKLDSHYVSAHFNLATMLFLQNRLDAAADEYREAVRCNPDYAPAYENLGEIRRRQGKMTEAVACWRQSLRCQPSNGRLANSLAWTLATSPNATLRNGAEAVVWAAKAVELSDGHEPIPMATLAAACAEAGRFDDAVKFADLAISLADAKKQSETAAAVRKQREAYRKNEPYRDISSHRASP